MSVFIHNSILFDTLELFENCTGNFCMANYYFLIKINQNRSMKLKNEFTYFKPKFQEKKNEVSKTNFGIDIFRYHISTPLPEMDTFKYLVVIPILGSVAHKMCLSSTLFGAPLLCKIQAGGWRPCLVGLDKGC